MPRKRRRKKRKVAITEKGEKRKEDFD